MDLGLADKVALVAGGSSGLGYAVAAALRSEGAHVSIGARDPERLAEAAARLSAGTSPAPGAGTTSTTEGASHGGGGSTAGGAEPGIHTQVVDVRDDAAVRDWVDAVARRYGRVHIVVANSGGPPAGVATDFELAAYRDSVELNLLSSISLVQHALPHLQSAGWGRILFITSRTVREPDPKLALSNTSRAGVVGYAKSLVAALGPGEITVNVLAPGITRTPRMTELYGERLDQAATGVPLERVAEPEEFGAVAAFLASTRASYVTGAVLPVDGGATRFLL